MVADEERSGEGGSGKSKLEEKHEKGRKRENGRRGSSFRFNFGGLV